MGLNLKDLVVRDKTRLESFASKVVAVDAYNAMYQFLSTVRGPDGASLADSRGRVTSHVSGLLYRNVNYVSLGIKPVYVFDGKPPHLKSAEIERRKRIKRDASVKYESAVREGRSEDAKKWAQQTTSLTGQMISEAKEVLSMMGIPHVDAPSEGEATAARMTQTGAAAASASQDFDSVLFGARRLVRNFTTGGRRKVPGRNVHVVVEPEIIETEKCLAAMGISAEQLVDVGIMIGTDFNPDGFRGIGPKTALKLIKKHGKLEEIPVLRGKLDGVDYAQIRKIFLEPDVAEPGPPEFGSPDYDRLSGYLQDRDFSPERTGAALARLKKAHEKKSQTLERWFS